MKGVNITFHSCKLLSFYTGCKVDILSLLQDTKNAICVELHEKRNRLNRNKNWVSGGKVRNRIQYYNICLTRSSDQKSVSKLQRINNNARKCTAERARVYHPPYQTLLRLSSIALNSPHCNNARNTNYQIQEGPRGFQ